MKTLLTHIVSMTCITLLGGLLWSCDKWELPIKKTQRECVKPSGVPNTQITNRTVNFSITNATGTVDKVVWNFGGSGPNNTTTTSGLTANYTYPTSTTFSAKAILSNLCGDETTVIFSGTAADPIPPVVNALSATNVSITTATVSFVVTNSGTPNAVEYGIYYSTSSTPDATNSTIIPTPLPTVGNSTPVNLSNLTPNTKYYYVAYAKQPSGAIFVSSTGSFTTLVDPLTQDLIASVSFTNGSIKDATLYGNDITLMNGAAFTADRKGNTNSAVQLDGDNDYFYMKPNSILDQTNALSISIWIKPIMGQKRMIIYNKSRFSDGGAAMYSSLIKLKDDVGPDFAFNTDIMQGSDCRPNATQWKTLTFTGIPDLTEWHNIVMAYSGQSVRMYFDGKLMNQQGNLPANSIDYCPGGELKFGVQSMGVEQYFRGALDDIRIYKRALTAAEVEALYKQ